MSSPFLPWLDTMPEIDGAIQIGRGVAGAVVGQKFNVWRLTPGVSSGSIFDQDPLYANYPVLLRKTGKQPVENETFNLQIFKATVDNRFLQLGDVLVQSGSDPYDTFDTFVFAQHRPIGPSLFVRTESNISITRPQPYGGQSAQQPPTGAIKAPGYVGVAKAGEWPLILNHGSYSFTNAPGAVAAAVPAGLTQLNRIRDARKPDIPAALYREHFIVYLPLLPGEQPRELDRVNFPNEDRYELASIYTSEQTGLYGVIAIVEKLGT